MRVRIRNHSISPLTLLKEESNGRSVWFYLHHIKRSLTVVQQSGETIRGKEGLLAGTVEGSVLSVENLSLTNSSFLYLTVPPPPSSTTVSKTMKKTIVRMNERITKLRSYVRMLNDKPSIYTSKKGEQRYLNGKNRAKWLMIITSQVLLVTLRTCCLLTRDSVTERWGKRLWRQLRLKAINSLLFQLLTAMIADAEECVFIKLCNSHFILRTQLTDARPTEARHKKSQRNLREIVKYWTVPVATVMFSDEEGEGFETESAAVFVRLPHWSHLWLMKRGHTSCSTSRTISTY